ncbi:MAG: hypothetical protein RI897_1758 [Verrucomicrobiota bacterium]
MEVLLAEGGFGVIAGFFGEEFFRAGVEGAEAAGAAEGGEGVPGILAGGGEGEATHDLVGFDGVAEEVAGAEFGAIAALVAGGFTDGGLGGGGFEFALDDVVGLGEDDDAGGGFSDGGIEVGGGLAHHESADTEDGFCGGGASGELDGVAEGGADGDGEGDGIMDGAGDGEGFVGDGLSGGGAGDIGESFDVIDDCSDLDGEAAGGDEASGD